MGCPRPSRNRAAPAGMALRCAVMATSPPAVEPRDRHVASPARRGLPPGPRMPPIAQSLSWLFRPIPFMTACRRDHGDTYTMRLAGLPPFVVLSDPAAIKEVFTGDPDVFHAGSANSILRPILGESSLLLLDGDRHMKERRLMMPAFHGERMLRYARVMADAADRSIARWPMGSRFPLHHEMQEVTLDVIARAVFGLEEDAEEEPLRRSLTRMLAFGEQPALLLLIDSKGELRWRELHQRLGRMSPWDRFRRTIEEVDQRLLRAIRRRRARADGGEDVLSMLLAARDEEGQGLTDEQLVDEMKTLLVAGHETTATGLTWTVLELLRHPAILERLRDELAAGRDELLEAVVKEGLRLRPVVPMVGRTLQAPATVAGRRYDAGVILAPNIYLTHRNPAVWTDPDRFDPSRFVGTKPSPYAFMPFGGGVRRCIGLAFAMLEMKQVLRQIVTRTRLQLAPGYRPTLIRRGITFAVSDGLPLVMSSRTPA
jgi:cytochrome P450